MPGAQAYASFVMRLMAGDTDGAFRDLPGDASADKVCKLLVVDVHQLRPLLRGADRAAVNDAVKAYYLGRGGLQGLLERFRRSERNKRRAPRTPGRSGEQAPCPQCRHVGSITFLDRFFSAEPCPICLEVTPGDQGRAVFACGHQVCTGCVRRLILR